MNRTLAAGHELRVRLYVGQRRSARRAQPPTSRPASRSPRRSRPALAARRTLCARESRALRPPLRRRRAMAVLAGSPRRTRAVRARRGRARVRPRDRRRRLHGSVGRADREGARPGARHPARRGRARRVRCDRPQWRLRRALAHARVAQRSRCASPRTSCTSSSASAPQSFAELHASLARHGIDAHYEANGVLWIATEPYQVDEIDEEVELIRRFGGDARRARRRGGAPRDRHAARARRRLASRRRRRARPRRARLRTAARGARARRAHLRGLAGRSGCRQEAGRVVLDVPGRPRARAAGRARDERLSAARCARCAGACCRSTTTCS